MILGLCVDSLDVNLGEMKRLNMNYMAVGGICRYDNTDMRTMKMRKRVI